MAIALVPVGGGGTDFAPCFRGLDERGSWAKSSVGLILCSERDAAAAHYSLGSLGNTVLAREYELALPDEHRQVLDVLTAIRSHTSLEGAGLALQGNAERYLRSPQEMRALFADLPEVIDNSAELSQRLQFQRRDLGYEFPRYPVGEGETMISFLRERTREGFERRYGAQGRNLRTSARAQIEKELNLIEKLNLPGYF